MPLRKSLVLLLALGLFLPIVKSALPVAAQQGFAAPQFEQVWQRADLPVAQNAAARSWLWGPSPGEVRTEPFEGAPGGQRTVQYFDKARMELDPIAAPGSQWAATTGLLVVELVSGRLQIGPNSFDQSAPAAIPLAGDANIPADLAAGVPLYSSFHDLANMAGAPDRRAAQETGSAVVATVNRAGEVGALASSAVHYSDYSQETGHNIPDVFAQFMASRGLVYENGALADGQLLDPVYVLGYPISEAYWATVPIDGKPQQVLLQLYQRRVLTYIPGYDPAWQVQMGNVGRHYYSWRYESVQAAPPTAAPAPGAGDNFVHISGDQFYYRGAPVKLKGTNYWMSQYPFVGTWANWDGYTVHAELQKAKDLGVNAVRIGIPYDSRETNDTVWGDRCEREDAKCSYVNGWIANEMSQMLQLAALYDMKVLFVLFDWTDKFPTNDSPEYQKQLNYLNGVVAPFADDDRVIGWDLHNEPENYGPWPDPGGPGRIIDWLNRIAADVRKIDSRHPLTVGVGDYNSLWLSPNGVSILDIVDFVSFHCYNIGQLRTQVDAITARTSKPVLLEEFGWPTGPLELSSPEHVYDEATQQFVYRIAAGDAKNLAGVMQWALWDNPIGTWQHKVDPTVEAWFGLVRRDGTFKPAAADFRDSFPTIPLVSDPHSGVTLTRYGEKPAP